MANGGFEGFNMSTDSGGFGTQAPRSRYGDVDYSRLEMTRKLLSNVFQKHFQNQAMQLQMEREQIENEHINQVAEAYNQDLAKAGSEQEIGLALARATQGLGKVATNPRVPHITSSLNQSASIAARKFASDQPNEIQLAQQLAEERWKGMTPEQQKTEGSKISLAAKLLNSEIRRPNEDWVAVPQDEKDPQSMPVVKDVNGVKMMWMAQKLNGVMTGNRSWKPVNPTQENLALRQEAANKDRFTVPVVGADRAGGEKRWELKADTEEAATQKKESEMTQIDEKVQSLASDEASLARTLVGFLPGVDSIEEKKQKFLNRWEMVKQGKASWKDLPEAVQQQALDYTALRTAKVIDNKAKSTDRKPAPKPPAVPAGKIRVKRKSDGKTGTIDAKDFDQAKYEKL